MQNLNEIKNNIITSIKPDTLVLSAFDIIRCPSNIDYFLINLKISNYKLDLTESDLCTYFSLYNHQLINETTNIYFRYKIDECINDTYEYIIRLKLMPSNIHEHNFHNQLWLTNKNTKDATLRNKKINFQLYKFICEYFKLRQHDIW